MQQRLMRGRRLPQPRGGILRGHARFALRCAALIDHFYATVRTTLKLRGRYFVYVYPVEAAALGRTSWQLRTGGRGAEAEPMYTPCVKVYTYAKVVV